MNCCLSPVQTIQTPRSSRRGWMFMANLRRCGNSMKRRSKKSRLPARGGPVSMPPRFCFAARSVISSPTRCPILRKEGRSAWRPGRRMGAVCGGGCRPGNLRTTQGACYSCHGGDDDAEAPLPDGYNEGSGETNATFLLLDVTTMAFGNTPLAGLETDFKKMNEAMLHTDPTKATRALPRRHHPLVPELPHYQRYEASQPLMVEGKPREDQGSSVSRADNAQLPTGLRSLLDEQPAGDSGRRARSLRIALRTEAGGGLNQAVTRVP